MKNLIYSTALAAIIALPAFAINSELSIGMANQQKFTMAFDNNFYATPSTTYNVTNVLPGNHHVRMTSAPQLLNGSWSIPQMLFDGFVNIPENTRLTAYPINFTQLNIVSIVPLIQQSVYYNPYDPNYNNNGYNNGNPYGNNGNPYGTGYNYGNPYGNGCQNPSGYQNPNYGYGNYPPVNYGMSTADFSALKNSINAQSFDSSKLSIAKQAISSNTLTAAQVKELVGIFDFDSSKLEIAKFAYGKTVDRNNYYQVNDAFTFSSSIDELATYINNYHA